LADVGRDASAHAAGHAFGRDGRRRPRPRTRCRARRTRLGWPGRFAARSGSAAPAVSAGGLSRSGRLMATHAPFGCALGRARSLRDDAETWLEAEVLKQ